jgi:hypothetical protein
MKQHSYVCASIRRSSITEARELISIVDPLLFHYLPGILTPSSMAQLWATAILDVAGLTLNTMVAFSKQRDAVACFKWEWKALC